MDLDFSTDSPDLGTIFAYVLGLPPKEGGAFPHGFVVVEPFPFEG